LFTIGYVYYCSQISKEGIMSMSSSGQITSINMAAREMFGLLPKAGNRWGQGPIATAGEDAAPPVDLQMQELVPEIDGRPNYLRRGKLAAHPGMEGKVVCFGVLLLRLLFSQDCSGCCRGV